MLGSFCCPVSSEGFISTPPGASSKLKPTLVKISGIPVEFWEEGILRHVCKMIGKTKGVDKVLSMERVLVG
jgi:hypothetical protein